tara:strand:- start:1981 stop:2811 length:831 start_codon:yes stop_codon:yes gene_type:complete
LFTFVDNIQDLAYLNKELLQKPYVGVDTEFRRTTKNNMKLALIQVNDDEEIYLIDAISIQEPRDHASFLYSNHVTKVFHSFKEDLEAIYSWTKKNMKNIFDTQIANSFLDGDYAISYQGLVEQELDIILNKNETRSNWMRRPLTDSQLKYAALDVEYLIHLYKSQKEALSKTSKLKWLDQDIERLLRITSSQVQIPKELVRSLSKAQETEILIQFNRTVDEISKREKIHPTLFFSKKSQKDFLRLIYLEGLEAACNSITPWRDNLIREPILDILEK